MAAGTLNWDAPRNHIFEAIIREIGSWADMPRWIFTQAHYDGKSVEEIALQSGFCPREVSLILETYEEKLRNALKTFRLS